MRYDDKHTKRIISITIENHIEKTPQYNDGKRIISENVLYNSFVNWIGNNKRNETNKKYLIHKQLKHPRSHDNLDEKSKQ